MPIDKADMNALGENWAFISGKSTLGREDK